MKEGAKESWILWHTFKSCIPQDQASSTRSSIPELAFCSQVAGTPVPDTGLWGHQGGLHRGPIHLLPPHLRLLSTESLGHRLHSGSGPVQTSGNSPGLELEPVAFPTLHTPISPELGT